jgi:SAM-dependent methyltransferase
MAPSDGSPIRVYGGPEMANRFHQANRRRWDAGSGSWARRADTRGIWNRCHQDPSLVLHPAEIKWLDDIAGKSAKVTSVDISEPQLDVARQRAIELGLDVQFLRADVLDLSSLGTTAFDIVYTGGHVAVWVSDLRRYYAEAARILKPGGLLIVSEYHPFRRVWKRSPSQLEVGSNYFHRGPYPSHVSEDVLYPAPGQLEQFEFHWTVADYVSAIVGSGCRIVHVEEFGDTSEEWEGAPLNGLPATLLLVGRRED